VQSLEERKKERKRERERGREREMNDDGDDVPANLPPPQNGRHRNNFEHN
jgi:hypothetical protein